MSEFPQQNNAWFLDGQEQLSSVERERNRTGRARNIILFVGDGLDVVTVTAARIRQGQLRGQTGEENLLSFEHFPHRALLKTYNTNQQVPDSAGAGTALIAGVKTKAGVVGLDEKAVRSDCASAKGREVVSIAALAQRAGLATGVVTDARLTHATPAATFGHSPERNWESDADMPLRAIREGCIDLARQLVEGRVGASLDVAMGGGRRVFLPESFVDSQGELGVREDERNLIDEWQAARPQGRYVSNREELLSLEPGEKGPVLGLFAADHMEFQAGSDPVEPSLPEMTAKAIEILSQNKKGYFLLVEAGRIDHAHHYDNAYRALAETIELAEAVDVALERTNPDDTLIIVTADHGHTMTFSGYPTRGNPILGVVVGNDSAGNPEEKPTLALDGKPYTTLSYANGMTAPRGRRIDLSADTVEAENFQQPALVPLAIETHGGADVPSFALGPRAHLLTGTAEQSYVFNVMLRAGDLTVPR